MELLVDSNIACLQRYCMLGFDRVELDIGLLMEGITDGGVGVGGIGSETGCWIGEGIRG